MDFHNNLKSKRKELKLTQQELADKLHVTRQTLSRWENNLGYPNLDTLIELSNILKTPLDSLLKGGQPSLANKITNDVKAKQTYKRYLFGGVTLIMVIFLWLGFLSYGRSNQISWIDKTNPFIKTQVGYAVLPISSSKNNHKKDVYVSDDSFGTNGSWLKIYFGQYNQDNKWAKIKHKGSYVYSYRLITKNQIPKEMEEQAGKDYIPYVKKSEPNRVNKDSVFPFE
ncbi:YxeA family protein [Fructilactobacillus vespulae]|uniref:YxeA family protein n=1 Tax=Fructilactobacillus vespulae TaxID=1249630 RepID=UPI0039B3C9BA